MCLPIASLRLGVRKEAGAAAGGMGKPSLLGGEVVGAVTCKSLSYGRGSKAREQLRSPGQPRPARAGLGELR